PRSGTSTGCRSLAGRSTATWRRSNGGPAGIASARDRPLVQPRRLLVRMDHWTRSRRAVRRDLVVPIDSTGVRERAGQRRETGPRLLLISMYPLDRGLWGPTVRITHLRDELARMVRLDVIDGYRGARRLAVAAPSVGLARAVLAERPVVLLPPGSREPLDVPLDSDASDLLFVGNARDDVQGAPRLIEAVTRARTRHEFVTLTIVCRPGEEP